MAARTVSGRVGPNPAWVWMVNQVGLLLGPPAAPAVGAGDSSADTGSDHRVITVVKAVHTAIWLAVESAVIYLLATGLAGRTSRRTAIAGAVVVAEATIYLANGAHCPLTGVAESLGADDGSVTDIFLPRWFARSLPIIHVPLILGVGWLHLRNLRASRG